MRATRSGAWGAALAAGLVAAPAVAGGRTITADPFPKKPSLDGVLREWSGSMTSFGEVLSGAPREGDPRAAAYVGYDERAVYVGAKIVDARLTRTAAAGEADDRITLHLAFPKVSGGYQGYSVDIFPGDPGKLAGVVKLGGAPIAGAKVVEAPEKGGYTVEAEIPWAAFREAATTRVGLRAALRYTDVDAGGVTAVVATASGKAVAELPPLLLEAEAGLDATLLRDKGLAWPPRLEVYGNVAGDAAVERVAQLGGYLTITGHRFRGGKQFYFAELGVPEPESVRRLELVDFDGDGRGEIVIVKRLGTATAYREALVALRLGDGDVPAPLFAHELSIVTPEGRVVNELRFPSQGKLRAIEIAQGEASGFEPDAYAEPKPGDMPSALLPWESVGSRTWRWDGKAMAKVSETPHEPRATGRPKRRPPAEEGPPPPPPPRPPTADELLDRVYALYRKERGVGESRPRFDFVTDVAGGSETERVLVHQRDIVVFGKGFRAGTSYAFITVGVADPRDVLDATARDLTGDGKAEILVRGVLHAKSSKELGEKVVDRHALFVYRVAEDGVRRVFAAETSRAFEGQRILGAVAWQRAGGGKVRIELRPGRALGWTERTYPFPIDTAPAGGLEPLLVPWGGVERRVYAWDGAAFTAQ
ncbi:MAG: hypothetical protein IT376_04910 [Polyangiaceae bacterium]|nr:hypothetical protein [Polyangiaceae bacterium]